MKYLIATAVWQRPHIFKAFVDRCNALRNKFDLEVLAVGSPYDLCENICKDNDIIYHSFPNKPLGAKLNHRLKIIKDLKPERVIFCGSDDIISDRTIEVYEQNTQDIVAFYDLYIFDTLTKQMVYSKGYTNHRKGETIAVGRCMSYEVLERLNFNIWGNNLNNNLDGSAWSRIKRLPVSVKYLKHLEQGSFICDLKSEDNISNFRNLPHHEMVDAIQRFDLHLGKKEREKIFNL